VRWMTRVTQADHWVAPALCRAGEYMTGGTAVILGPTGKNFGAGGPGRRLLTGAGRAACPARGALKLDACADTLHSHSCPPLQACLAASHTCTTLAASCPSAATPTWRATCCPLRTARCGGGCRSTPVDVAVCRLAHACSMLLARSSIRGLVG